MYLQNEMLNVFSLCFYKIDNFGNFYRICNLVFIFTKLHLQILSEIILLTWQEWSLGGLLSNLCLMTYQIINMQTKSIKPHILTKWGFYMTAKGLCCAVIDIVSICRQNGFLCNNFFLVEFWTQLSLAVNKGWYWFEVL